MDALARRFRIAARRCQHGKTGRAIRYPEDLHRAAVSYAAARRKRGDPLSAISRDLGIKPMTLTRWLQNGQNPEFRRVEILATTSSASGSGASPGVTVTVPGGIRIEGLDLESLIILLHRLA